MQWDHWKFGGEELYQDFLDQLLQALHSLGLAKVARALNTRYLYLARLPPHILSSRLLLLHLKLLELDVSQLHLGKGCYSLRGRVLLCPLAISWLRDEELSLAIHMHSALSALWTCVSSANLSYWCHTWQYTLVVKLFKLLIARHTSIGVVIFQHVVEN